MSVIQPPGRPGVEPDLADGHRHRKEIARTLNRMNKGQISSTLFVTLDPGVATTVVIDARLSAQTCVSLQPQTSNAAAAIGTTWMVVTDGTMTIHHANNAQIDRTFTAGFVG